MKWMDWLWRLHKMEIPTREVLEDMLSITFSVIKRAVQSVLENLWRRDVKLFPKELTQALLWWAHPGSSAMDRQTDKHISYFLEPLEPIYNPIFLCVKAQQDLHLHPTSISTTVITGNSIFFEKKTPIDSRQPPRRRCGRFHSWHVTRVSLPCCSS